MKPFVVFLIWGLAAEAASAAGPVVPPNMQGVWGRHGRCDLQTERLTITAHAAGWGAGPFGKIEYDPVRGAIIWSAEGNVDEFVVGRTPDTLVHNVQGPQMPGEEGYARCGRQRVRVSWPPH